MNRVIIVFILLLFSCNNNPVNEIENPNGIWTEVELSELNLIVLQFDEILLNEFQVNSVDDGYIQYSEFFLENIHSVPVFKNFENLSDQLSEMTVFNKIWVKFENSDKATSHINLAMDSSYLSYLKHLGKKSKFVDDYADKIHTASDIQPTLVIKFAKNIKEIDLIDKNNRLIFAIHYLTLMNR